MCNQRALKACLSADCGFFFGFFYWSAQHIFFTVFFLHTLGSSVFPPLLLPFICVYPETDMSVTLTHTPSAVMFPFLFLMMRTTKEPFKTKLQLSLSLWAHVCVCVCLYLRVCVYPTWAECRHQAQTSSICPNSTAVYKAQTSNITTKLHSLIKTLFTVAMIIYPVTCALHKSKHRGMPMCVCVGWQKYTAAAGPHVWRPALHTP